MSNQVAIVTGASRGIGRGIALGLAEVCWNIVINYRGNAEAAAETVDLVQAQGSEGLAVKANVSEAADRQTLVEQAINRFGRIDLLVNNAGMGPRQRLDILEASEESYDEVMAVNLKGPYFLTQSVAKMMISLRQDGTIETPNIINISSISAYTSSPSRGGYCISKAGLNMVTRLFADRLAEYGINVYEIRPGIVKTDMTSTVTEKYDKLIGAGLTPIKRWGEPDDIARAVVAIAEGYFPFTTGDVINVDGGFHMHRL